MNYKQNAKLSFLVVGVIYLLAVVVGVVTYNLLNYEFYVNLFIADFVSTVFVFIFSVIIKNASVYDPYWSVQPPIILTLYAIKYGVNAYIVCLLLAVWFWAIRLTVNWAINFKDLTHQDWRYTMLKEKTGKFYPVINFVGIHLVPTVVVYFCLLPTVFAVMYQLNGNAFSVLFCFLCIASATLQAVSDVQMLKYRKCRTTNFIRVGLWKYSRHPNYLGEICMWWSVGLSVVVCEPDFWYLLIGAVLNTLLFLFVSIPMADKRQAKKQGFEEYKKQTRILLPIKK